METTKTIELDQCCSSCQGTGLYSGMAESKHSAVVCYLCKGTGKEHYVHTYKEFTKRKERKGIQRVFEANPGIKVGEGTSKDGKVWRLSDFGGMPYTDWAKGKPFPAKSEMRAFTCPLWWAQSTNTRYKAVSGWEKCKDALGSLFSDCRHFKDKASCWDLYDSEQNERQQTERKQENEN
jgi:hypothetical protein